MNSAGGRRGTRRIRPGPGFDIPGFVEPVIRRTGAAVAHVAVQAQVQGNVAYRWSKRQDLARPSAIEHADAQASHRVDGAHARDHEWRPQRALIVQDDTGDGAVFEKKFAHRGTRAHLAAGRLDQWNQRLGKGLRAAGRVIGAVQIVAHDHGLQAKGIRLAGAPP